MKNASTYIRGVYEAWKGEVFGEVFFTELAQLDKEASMEPKWNTLAELERVTAGVLLPLVRRYGLPMKPPAEERTRGEQEAKRFSTMPHEEFMAYLEPYLEEVVAKYQTLRDDAPSTDATPMQFLVDHEEALLRFVQIERGGTGEDSLQEVKDVVARASEATLPLDEDIFVASHDHSPFAFVTGNREGKRLPKE